MKKLLIYDSYFGNTQKIAQAIGDALGIEGMRTVEVTPDLLRGLDLLVVGSPTRAFRPSPATAALLKALPFGALSGTRVAAFDTRMEINEKTPAVLRILVRIFGYAAEPIANGLKKRGGTLIRKARCVRARWSAPLPGRAPLGSEETR